MNDDGSRTLQSARRGLDGVQHAPRIDVVNHVTGARRDDELAVGNAARELERMARRIEITVLRRGTGAGLNSVLSLCGHNAREMSGESVGRIRSPSSGIAGDAVNGTSSRAVGK
ncbi:MAG TPA: hypothetical protein VGF58_21920 [Burkholderiales bacterium]|jgi:hypothetical protein